MPRPRFLGDTGVPLPEFQGEIHNFWGTHQIFEIFTSYIEKLSRNFCSFLFKFELDVNSFGWRRDVDDSKVVSALALVLNSPANLLFLY